MIKFLTSRISAYLFIFLLVTGVPFFVLFLQAEHYTLVNFLPQEKSGYLNGEPTGKFDKLFKEAFPLKDFSVTLLNAINYTVFNEARKGAIIGLDGWIFSDEEFVWRADSARSVDAHISEILDVEAKLEEQGKRLVVALVPQKSVVYGERLGKLRLPNEQIELYNTVREKLLAHTRLILPDVKSALMSGKLGDDMFLHTDTHWTVNGAGVAATIIAKSIPQSLLRKAKQLKRVATTPVKHPGDLLKFVDLGIWSSFLPVRDETIVPVTATVPEASVDEFLASTDEIKQQEGVALVGTSYSANSMWSFQAQLELSLGVSIRNYAQEGKGYAAPMKSFLESSDSNLNNVHVVIWEIPVRYLVAEISHTK